MSIQRSLAERVFIYDTTLRDGAQGEGINFSEAGKIRFALMLDKFGVDFIEGGFAGSNPRDRRFFEDIAREKLTHAKVVAFGSTRRADRSVESDEQLAGLLAAECEWVTIYGKSWLLHVTDVLRTTPDNNLRMIGETVGYLRKHGRQVFYDAEHFFDGYKDNPEYAVAALQAAVDEGAAGVILCDTNGGTLPHEIFEITKAVTGLLPEGYMVGIHTHNDSGLAVANSLESVRAGARQVQGCINGYGERSGNANLVSIIPSLELKMGYRCVGRERLRSLRSIAMATADLVNQRPDLRQPFVGRGAFCHKAGAHVNGIQKNSRSFEHIEPELVGNERQIVVSELAGASNIVMKAQELGVTVDELDKQAARSILAEIKQLENQGYSYEGADGSFKIVLQKILKQHTPFFELDGFRVIVEKRGKDQPCITEATVKVKVADETELTAGEGSGPVDALNAALRQALTRFYPEISDVTLTDYSVRILDPQEATKAVTRVLIESGDGKRSWSTVGVSENIIEASWQALLDSVEYKLFADRNG